MEQNRLLVDYAEKLLHRFDVVKLPECPQELYSILMYLRYAMTPLKSGGYLVYNYADSHAEHLKKSCHERDRNYGEFLEKTFVPTDIKLEFFRLCNKFGIKYFWYHGCGADKPVLCTCTDGEIAEESAAGPLWDEAEVQRVTGLIESLKLNPNRPKESCFIKSRILCCDTFDSHSIFGKHACYLVAQKHGEARTKASLSFCLK